MEIETITGTSFSMFDTTESLPSRSFATFSVDLDFSELTTNLPSAELYSIAEKPPKMVCEYQQLVDQRSIMVKCPVIPLFRRFPPMGSIIRNAKRGRLQWTPSSRDLKELAILKSKESQDPRFKNLATTDPLL
jgi:hypothetical protein